MAGTCPRHRWTREENKELLLCYYAANPSERGFRVRLLQLWNDRHLGEDRQCTEQQLAGQVNSVLRRNVFSDLELAEFKRNAVPSSHLVPPTKGNADCTNQHAPFDVDFNCSQPTDDMAMTDDSSVNDSVSILPSELMPIKDKLSSLCQELKDTNKLRT